jgi:hypothetical protein
MKVILYEAGCLLFDRLLWELKQDEDEDEKMPFDDLENQLDYKSKKFAPGDQDQNVPENKKADSKNDKSALEEQKNT